jgi:predicted nucleotide-binding protein (sugar kinase/HSP70/actin superfamily)
MIWVLLFTFFKMLMMKTRLGNNNQEINTVTKLEPSKMLINKHFRRPIERPFYKDEKSTTTVLIGGLSSTHDRLIAAALCNLDLKAEALPPTNLSAFELGREFGNNGYCNPTYFTVGNLISYLRELEDQGLTKAELIDKYVFLTAGCNAPCRFGLIEIEYRMALKDAGYEGFRVLVFKKEDGLSQDVRGLGIEINSTFFLALVNAINMADILTSYVNGIRPLEVIAGQTHEVKERAIIKLIDVLKNKKSLKIKRIWRKVFNFLELEKIALFIYTFYDQLTNKENTLALNQISSWFSEVEIDPFRSKTIVKITGELWAGSTEGDGNFNMHNFLESEGAVVLIEPVATYIQFMLHKHILRHTDRKEIILTENVNNWWQILQKASNRFKYYKKFWVLHLANKLYRKEFARLMNALEGQNHMLIEQNELQNVAHKYYHTHIEGGEGYMEVAKNIYYHKKKKCHMVLSLKPFGCMPSTQSDGVQAAVVEHHKNMIFLPVETSGEGKTNAHNRVLMALAEARDKARKEITDAYAQSAYTFEELKKYVNKHPELKTPTYSHPHRKGVASKAANFIYHVDELLRATG